MQKYCSKCNCEVEENARFCPMCGSPEFTSVDSEATTVLNENMGYPPQPHYNQPDYSAQQPSQPQTSVNSQQVPQFQQAVPFQPPVAQKKKGLKGWQIALIVVGVIAFAGIASIVVKVFRQQGYGDSPKPQTSYFSEDNGNNSVEDNGDNFAASKIEYTKGTLSDDGIYTNAWADIKFVMPEGFSNADSSTYSNAEDSTTDCGMYFIADDTMSLVCILYEKLPDFPKYDEESYLDAVMESIETQMPTGIKYETTDRYTTQTIAGYAYAKAECNFNNGYGDFVQSFYVRKQGDYMIAIYAMGMSYASNDDLVSRITKVD